MTPKKTDILVYAHWVGMTKPKLIGTLSAHQAKGRKSYGFEYDPDWLQSKEQILLDPDVGWYSGPQFPVGKENFGMFLDSMPDTWGRTLMKRRAIQQADEQGKVASTLYDIDYLLGVHDQSRMGALRFKQKENGPFLDDNKEYPTPPWSSVRDLQYASGVIESDADSKEIKKWLSVLLAPGSSLGGARPKANIIATNGHPWIAKFPSKNDTIDKAKWEFLAYRLASESGVEMAESEVHRVAGNYHTFFTKRFDRVDGERIHFASAMTMTGNTEGSIRDHPKSYLDLAEFIQFSGSNIEEDLHQLWRRIVFNISISNTDDHLRNHGFILKDNGWRLSPAYDINPSVDKGGLALNIDADNNALDIDLAKSTGEYYQLTLTRMNDIIKEVKSAVSGWKTMADNLAIPRSEQQIMEPAFR
jgi:serine/threonine-protein kinase HipA